MLRAMWKVLNNSFFGLIVGIILTFLTFFLQKKEIKLGYEINNQNLIASNDVDTNITIQFKNNIVPNLNLVEIALWNHGSDFLDKSSISITDPLRITSDSATQIMNFKILSKSRNNLHFMITSVKNNAKSELILQIAGDDGLEKFDGIKLQILYSGSEKANWYPTGRIKGSLNSFSAFDESELIKYRKSQWYDWLTWIILFTFPTFLIFLMIIKIKQKKFETDIPGGIFAFGLPLILIYFSIKHIWYLLFLSGSLSWLLNK